MLPTGVPEYRVRTTPSAVEHWRHLVEIAALIIAAVWGFYVFVYQERIKPAGELPRLQITENVTHEPLQHGKELVTITMTMKNIGSNVVSMAAVVVNAYGVNYQVKTSGASEVFSPAGGVAIVNNGLKSRTPKMLYAHEALWSPLGGSTRLGVPPGEEISLASPFVIERGAYDTLRLTYGYCYQRADDNASSTYPSKRAADGGFDVRNLTAQKGVHQGLLCGGTLSYNGEYAL